MFAGDGPKVLAENFWSAAGSLRHPCGSAALADGRADDTGKRGIVSGDSQAGGGGAGDSGGAVPQVGGDVLQRAHERATIAGAVPSDGGRDESAAGGD